MKIICMLLAVWLAFAPALAKEIDLYSPTPEAAPTPAPPISAGALLDAPPMDVNCAAVLLMEPESGQVIFEMNAETERPAASVTKIMTILLTLEAIESCRITLDQPVTISANASGMGGSQVLLDTGEVQSVEILLKSCIVGSANDACVALAELMYGSEALCVEKMNARAAELGMAHTRFVNCTGLPAEGQHTTARDIAVMTAAMLRHDLYFKYAAIWLDEIDHGDGRKTQLTNTNKLTRRYDGCDGGKTGSTAEAGCCISATARRGGMRLIAVVLGAGSGSDRFDIAAAMLDYGFANCRLYPVAARGTKVRGRLPVNGGRPEAISLELNGDLTLLLMKGEESNVRLVPDLPEALNAPVRAGEEIGFVRVEYGGRALAKLPVIASESAEPTGLSAGLRRIWQNWFVA